jgi:hypothetical protein
MLIVFVIFLLQNAFGVSIPVFRSAQSAYLTLAVLITVKTIMSYVHNNILA